MNKTEELIIEKFKSLILLRLNVHKIFLFGSRARGDAHQYSDMDIIVVVNDEVTEKDIDYVSDCAWESGFNHGIVLVPIVYSKEEWEKSAERYSLLAQAVKAEGIPI